MSAIRAAVIGFSLTGLSVATLADEWPQFAGDAARHGTATRAARDLNIINWSVTPAADEEYAWRSSPVVYGGRVFVNARYFVDDAQVGNRVVAYAVEDGERLWATPIEIDDRDSWSSPAVDVRNGAVIIGSGHDVFCLDMTSGAIVWQRELEHEIVNASPAVTSDLYVNSTPANCILITDYTGYLGSARLYAINVDPNEPTDNPYEPGAIVWTELLPGASGNTPAYADGVVYVTSVAGTVKALDACDGSLVWQTDVDFHGYPPNSGFYGGITLRNGYAYAASYSFYGSSDNSGLFKFDLLDGSVVWDTPCERTNSIPVVTDDGRIFLAGGLDGFGAAVKIEAFQDNGATATKLWDTYANTGGALVVGGWTHQPVFSRGYIYTGTPSEDALDYGEPATDMYILDAGRSPNDPEFIVDQYAGAGGSSAIADGTVYSFGEDGLFAFEPSLACKADTNGDGLVGIADLAALLSSYGWSRGDPSYDSDADMNRDGVVDLSDLAILLSVYGEACV